MNPPEESEDANAPLDRLAAHLRAPPTPPKVPVYALPDQPYLETTVLPLLLRGLEEVVKVRPADPLAFLAAYLLSNNPQRVSHPLLTEEGRRVPLQEIAQRAADVIKQLAYQPPAQPK
ncbi:Dpy-30 motif containing protein, putative [Trypanosoma equiperdum]|uniref:Dpy-30 motif containing protein n=2 Tax=Trypanozoon TaxID=39700 RepID=C9ZZX4_TRYB9|nr:hypothetical protein, unlikely [Trypanosoma brucei gambiense DAL972]CBH16532.1 hypothetical protein, unlikely [Trypanosoma brucei gambiense DAL972]SCU69305.1 Dpy-30 motif containing protein, putative [Trypanosoma equiperdum]|eukprot:XP_011778796.1 hypothetical protein, unlikely [Trypanosoma brucei gambiense DAL972]